MTKETAPQLHLDNQLCFPVYTLSRLITQAYQPVLKKLGLTYPQYLVMLVLWEADEQERLPVPVRFITDRLLLDTGTVTPLLKRMEEAGLLSRRRSSADERVVEICLTEQGKVLRSQAETVPFELLCRTGVDPQRGLAMRDEMLAMIRVLQQD
jgi:DNA-binding MarR family transcriptional regulator